MAEAEEKAEITLGLLNAVEKNSEITQRSVSKDLGIALGLTNTYLKRCIKKGLIKISQAPANRYSYYLTPKGFVEKARLTGEYLSQGFQFFRITRVQVVEIFDKCARNSWHRLAFYGLTDVTEIAFLSVDKSKVQITGIVDPKSKIVKYQGVQVVTDIGVLPATDAIILMDLGDIRQNLEQVSQKFSRDRIFVPDLLSNDLLEEGNK